MRIASAGGQRTLGRLLGHLTIAGERTGLMVPRGYAYLNLRGFDDAEQIPRRRWKGNP
jgi:hypothetical protein